MQRRRYQPENQVQNSEPSVAENELFTTENGVSAANLTGKIIHYELYATDGYINTGVAGDQTNIAGWPAPVYIWGFTDHDPNVAENQMSVPAGNLAHAPLGPVGNAKFPAPFLECRMGEHVFITVHNRGFLQALRTFRTTTPSTSTGFMLKRLTMDSRNRLAATERTYDISGWSLGTSTSVILPKRGILCGMVCPWRNSSVC
jgi:hypothetical protein